jgi:hypothetical protein
MGSELPRPGCSSAQEVVLVAAASSPCEVKQAVLAHQFYLAFQKLS